MVLTTIDSRTFEETAASVKPDFPYRAASCNIHELSGHCFPWHWHEEVEFFFIESGAMDYQLCGGIYHFSEGDAGFINSNVLHMTRCEKEGRCRQQEHIFLPKLVSGDWGSVIESKYVLPLLNNKSANILHFKSNTVQAHQMREIMNRAFTLNVQKPNGYEILVRSLMSELWLITALHAPSAHGSGNVEDDARIKVMLSYISEHYPFKINLSELAAAAHVGIRESERCFKRQLGMTPFEYIIKFRINKACEMLRTKNASIEQVGHDCGFASGSYFGKLFKQEVGCTPSEYRKRYAK